MDIDGEKIKDLFNVNFTDILTPYGYELSIESFCIEEKKLIIKYTYSSKYRRIKFNINNTNKALNYDLVFSVHVCNKEIILSNNEEDTLFIDQFIRNIRKEHLEYGVLYIDQYKPFIEELTRLVIYYNNVFCSSDFIPILTGKIWYKNLNPKWD